METKIPELAEISIRYSTKIKASERIRIKSSRDAYQVFRGLFPDIEHRERFIILCLNRANQVLGYHTVSVGGISGTIADIRIIFQIAIKANASAIICSHNHPSGNYEPSHQDKNLTNKIKDAGTLLDISFLDHLILTDESYMSFADENYL
jgi:DNA repair protein RadC